MGVLEPGEDPRLVALGARDLEGDQPVAQAHLLGQEDPRERPAAQLEDEAEPRDLLTDPGRRKPSVDRSMPAWELPNTYREPEPDSESRNPASGGGELAGLDPVGRPAGPVALGPTAWYSAVGPTGKESSGAGR